MLHVAVAKLAKKILLLFVDLEIPSPR